MCRRGRRRQRDPQAGAAGWDGEEEQGMESAGTWPSLQIDPILFPPVGSIFKKLETPASKDRCGFVLRWRCPSCRLAGYRCIRNGQFQGTDRPRCFLLGRASVGEGDDGGTLHGDRQPRLCPWDAAVGALTGSPHRLPWCSFAADLQHFVVLLVPYPRAICCCVSPRFFFLISFSSI